MAARSRARAAVARPRDLVAWCGRILLLSAENDELYGVMHQRLRALYPHAESVTFAGGHAATIGRGTEYVAAVRRFLAAG